MNIHQDKKVLTLIGAFKLLKAAILFVVAFKLHQLLNQDAKAALYRWAVDIRVDPQDTLPHLLIAKLTGLSHLRLHELGVGTFLYGLLFGTEGIGLILHKRWAEYVAVISTSGFLPVEVYEVIHHITWMKGILLAANLAIVIYLVFHLGKSWRPGRSTAATGTSAEAPNTGRPV